jgi:1-acyl-sn-glycerol-3-phosphate acyltransferase
MQALLESIRGLITFLLFALNLAVWGTIFLIISVLKLPVWKWRKGRDSVVLLLARIAEIWVKGNNDVIALMLDIDWIIDDRVELRRNGRYLILCNHQTWVDIPIVARQFYRRAAFIRFFLKQELIWVPLAGLACWALEFPFMKRYTPEYLERHPEKRGKDLDTTRRACRRYSTIPVAILNFVEGTRFTREKREDQRSPYRHLLRPRAGGISYVLASLGSQLDAVVDVTITYDLPEVSLWDFLCNRIRCVAIDVRPLDVPPRFLGDAVTEDGVLREEFKGWMSELWERKDRLIGERKQELASRSTVRR